MVELKQQECWRPGLGLMLSGRGFRGCLESDMTVDSLHGEDDPRYILVYTLVVRKKSRGKGSPAWLMVGAAGTFATSGRNGQGCDDDLVIRASAEQID